MEFQIAAKPHIFQIKIPQLLKISKITYRFDNKITAMFLWIGIQATLHFIKEHFICIKKMWVTKSNWKSIVAIPHVQQSFRFALVNIAFLTETSVFWMNSSIVISFRVKVIHVGWKSVLDSIVNVNLDNI